MNRTLSVGPQLVPRTLNIKTKRNAAGATCFCYLVQNIALLSYLELGAECAYAAMWMFVRTTEYVATLCGRRLRCICNVTVYIDRNAQ